MISMLFSVIKYLNLEMTRSVPNIKKLDEYIGSFYEDALETKIKSSKDILQLFQDFSNLEALLEHDSLLPVLSRTLAENHKRNIDLSVYILSVFYILSNYQQFQELLTENKVGITIMDVLENQIQRFDLLYSEYIEMWRKNNEEDRVSAKKKLKILNVLIWKQDKLFFVCLNILFNISANPAIEKKMRKAGLVQILIRCLERNDFHLLIVTLGFLRKLSVIAEYKDQMLAVGLVDKLERFFTCDNEILLNFALMVYYNLAFDKGARQSIENARLIPKFVHLLAQDSPNRMTALNILYLLSTEAAIRYTLAYTNCMDYVVKLILFPHPNIGAVELLGLAINLAANERNVEHLMPEDFAKLMDKAIRSEDPTLLKFCKNVLRSSKSQEIHSDMKGVIRDKLIKTVMTKTKNSEMCLELFGIMAGARLGKEWTDILLVNERFIDFMEKLMINGITQDDTLMEILALIANICQEAECCTLIQKLFEPVLTLFLGKEYDPEFICQVLYALYCYLFHSVGLQRILNEGEVLMRILDLIEDPNEGVREMNDEVLTILRETDDIELCESIKQGKFYQHNKKWLDQTEGVHDWYDNAYGYNEEMLDPRMWESEDDYD